MSRVIGARVGCIIRDHGQIVLIQYCYKCESHQGRCWATDNLEDDLNRNELIIQAPFRVTEK